MIGLRIIILSSISACSLAAEDPAWKKDLTSPEFGSHPRIKSGVLDLKVSWNGLLDSGKLQVQFAPKDAGKTGAYIVTSTASSLGLAAGIFPYSSSFWSELDAESLRPRLFTAVETDSEETTNTIVRHTPNRVVCKETTKPLPKGVSKTIDRTFEFSPVFDIFSAMLHIRSQKLATGDQINLVVQPFKTPYLVRVKVQGREAHLDRKTIRLTVGMRKINSDTLELLPYKKMKKDATLWLSDDDDRIPVEFRAAIFIGDIRATLTGFQK
jgi:hypothetical protein